MANESGLVIQGCLFSYTEVIHDLSEPLYEICIFHMYVIIIIIMIIAGICYAAMWHQELIIFILGSIYT